MLAARSSSDAPPSSNRNIVNIVWGDQFNLNNYYVYPPHPGNENHRPVNVAPVDLLSVHFTGRRNELEFLENALSTTHIGVPSRCVVHGMPGIGKTHLVLRYAKISFDQNRYSFVFWISATSVDKINQGISGILDLIGHRDRFQQDQTAKLTAAWLWLEQSDCGGRGGWLLVFDNVHRDTLGFLRSHLPLRNEKGNILFTTRTEDVAEALANAAGDQHPILRLQPLELRESAELLFKDAGIDVNAVTPSLLGQAEDLVKCVGRLPLAVVYAASFMKQTHTTVDGMLEFYKSGRKMDVIRWENDLSPYEARSVACTFENQFNELSQQSRDIGNLLKLISFLDPEKIPVTMIINGVKEVVQNRRRQVTSRPKRSILRKFMVWSRSRASDDVTETFRISPEFDSLITLILSPIKFQSAIQKLQNLSLVEHRSRGGTSSLWIHDLVQFMVREGVRKEETYDEWLQSSWSIVYGMLLLIEDPTLPQWWPDCETLIPHLQSLKQSLETVLGSNFEVTRANRMMARYLWGRGRYGEAEALSQRVVEWSKIHLGFHHLDTLMSMDSLACIYNSQGRFEEAEALYMKTLHIRETHLGVGHPDTLTSMNNVAFVYELRRRYGEAEVLHKKALDGREKILGAEHPTTLTSMSNLASVYESQGRYDDAEALCKKALESREKLLGADHPSTFTSVNNLASVYGSQGRFDEAEALYKKTIEGREKQLGAEHPDTLASMSRLASVYESQGRYDDAEVLFKKAIEGRVKQLGTYHPSTLTSMSDLASVYVSQGRLDEAVTMYKKTIEGREKQLGAEHPDTLVSMRHLASISELQGSISVTGRN